MAELIQAGLWWWLLIVPVLTFVFALFGSWWGSKLGKVTEHEQWLRNERLKAYTQFLLEEQPHTHETLIAAFRSEKPWSPPSEALFIISIVGTERSHAMARSLRALQTQLVSIGQLLYGPHAGSKPLDKYDTDDLTTLFEEVADLTGNLTDQIRKELKVK